MWVHACYLLDHGIGCFSCIILLLFHLDLKVVFEGSELCFGFELSCGDVLLEVVCNVLFGNVDKVGVFGVVVLLCCLFGQLGGVFGGASVYDVRGFDGPCGEWLVFGGGRVRNVGLEALLNKLGVRVDPCLNVGIFIEDLLID